MTKDAGAGVGLSDHVTVGRERVVQEAPAQTVVVLGMHRSGTSLAARLIRDLGWSLGSEDSLLGPRADNLDGFFERADVQVLNDRVLEELGASWDAPPSVEEVRTGPVDLWRTEVEQLVSDVAAEAGGSPLALKDPRLCVLWELWAPVLPRDLIAVVAVRDPLEIAGSLAARDNMPLHVGLALWETYIVRMLGAVAGRTVVVVRYDRLLERPDESVLLLASALGAATPPPGTSAAIRSDLHRSRADDGSRQLMTRSQTRLWDWLRSLPDGRQTIGHPDAGLSISPAATQLLEDRRQAVRTRRRVEAAEAEVRRTVVEISASNDRARAQGHELQELSAELDLARRTLTEAEGRADSAEMEWQQERERISASLRHARLQANASAARLRQAEQALESLQSEQADLRKILEGSENTLEALRVEHGQTLELVEQLRVRRLAQADANRDLEARLDLERERNESLARQMREERQSHEELLGEGAAALAAAHARARVLEYQRDNVAGSLVLVEGQRRALEFGLLEIKSSRTWRFGRWITSPLRLLRARLGGRSAA